MTVEEIQAQADEELSSLDTKIQEFMEKLSSLCMGQGSVGELDDLYKSLKQNSKTLNRLAKSYSKVKGA